ncbi:MAG: FliO/MopB family protein [Bdellovibrionales bacterium]|nr:FliO/MopB family protein [Bdellovibrionales bacterium]
MRILLSIILILIFCVPAFGSETSDPDSSVEKLRRIREQAQAQQIDAEAAETIAQEANESREDLGYVEKAIQGLALCLGVFFVLTYFMKKSQGIKSGTQERRLVLSEQISIGPKSKVALLSIDGKEILVGISESNIALLKELPPTRRPNPIKLEQGKVVSCINE